jgi:putative copper export protein
MSGATILFLTVRVLHVLLAAIWLGCTVFVVFFVLDADAKAGRMARRVNPFLNAVGGITVLAGFWLYWHLTGGFQPALSRTMAARVFGTGGLAGLIALIIGGAVVGRSWKKMDAAESDVMRRRVATWARVVLVLQIIALSLMAIGHCV